MAIDGSDSTRISRSLDLLFSLTVIFLLGSVLSTQAEERDGISTPPGVTITRDTATGRETITLGGAKGKPSRSDDSYMMNGARFSNDPQPHCLQGAAFFSITPSGLMIVFRSPRDKLSFSISEETNVADRTVSTTFVTPTCRLAIRAIKEVKQGGIWTRLVPAD